MSKALLWLAETLLIATSNHTDGHAKRGLSYTQTNNHAKKRPYLMVTKVDKQKTFSGIKKVHPPINNRLSVDAHDI